MKPTEAGYLAARLGAAFPRFTTSAAIDLRAEWMMGWEFHIALQAVDLLIENTDQLPTIRSLREAYGACGGDVYDPGRNMSPAVVERDPDAPRPTLEQIRAAERSTFDTAPNVGVGSSPKDDGQGDTS